MVGHLAKTYLSNLKSSANAAKAKRLIRHSDRPAEVDYENHIENRNEKTLMFDVLIGFYSLLYSHSILTLIHILFTLSHILFTLIQIIFTYSLLFAFYSLLFTFCSF